MQGCAISKPVGSQETWEPVQSPPSAPDLSADVLPDSELGTRVGGDLVASGSGPGCSVHKEIDTQQGTWLWLACRDPSNEDPSSHGRETSPRIDQSSAQPSPSLTAPSSRASSLCVPVGLRGSGPLESGPQRARLAIRAQGTAPGVRRCSLWRP